MIDILEVLHYSTYIERVRKREYVSMYVNAYISVLAAR